MTNKYIAKVVLCGDFGVGKTSLIDKALGKKFHEDHIPTLGIDFAVHTVSLENNVEIEMHLWDFGGQPAFHSLQQEYLKKIHASILVFDISNTSSFESLKVWVNNIRVNNENRSSPIMFVANKTDLQKFIVDPMEIDKFINSVQENAKDDFYLNYMLTSARTGLNVKECFSRVAKAIHTTYFNE
ncbi:MAG: Rab family GTPase [Candidatus Kariarchaeaceae archaeon]